jgi:hypothetical protein
LLFSTLILLLDLAQDGTLGKVKFVSLASSHHPRFSQGKCSCSGHVVSQPELLVSPQPGIPWRDKSWPLKPLDLQILKIIHFFLIGSAGGIPL